MNYIHLINNFWQMAATVQFTHFETALYFYFLNYLNRSRWQPAIIINSGQVIAFFQIHRNTLAAALDKINEKTMLKIDRKRGSKNIVISQKVAIENMQLYENNVQLENKKVAIENVQLCKNTNEVAQEVAQQPAIENVQLLQNSYSVHYYKKKNNNKYYFSKKLDKDIRTEKRKNLSENLNEFLQTYKTK